MYLLFIGHRYADNYGYSVTFLYTCVMTNNKIGITGQNHLRCHWNSYVLPDLIFFLRGNQCENLVFYSHDFHYGSTHVLWNLTWEFIFHHFKLSRKRIMSIYCDSLFHFVFCSWLSSTSLEKPLPDSFLCEN